MPSVPGLNWRATPAPTAHLNVWLPAGDEADAMLLEQQVDDFITATDGISLTVTLLEAEPRSLSLLLEDDPAPDLLEVDLFSLPQLVAEGRLAAFPTNEPTIDGFHPNLLQAATVDGSLYCLPKEAHTLGLFYNRTLFDAANIAYPSESWTWSDLSEAAEAIGGLPTVEFSAFGLALAADTSRWLPIYLAAGGEWTPESALDPAALRTALSQYENLHAEGLAITPSYYGRSWSGPIFGNGRVGLVIEGNWLADYLAQEFPDLDYGVAPLPSGPAGPASVAFGTCYAVNAASSEQTLAPALATHLAGDVAMAERLASRVAMPARTAPAIAWEATYPHLRALRTQLDGATIWQTTLAGEQTLETLQRLLADLVAGDLTVDEAVNQILQPNE